LTSRQPRRTGHQAPNDTKMTSNDDLRIAPKIVVDLPAKLQDTDVIPTSCDRESDIDVPPPPAIARRFLGFCERSPRDSHRL